MQNKYIDLTLVILIIIIFTLYFSVFNQVYSEKIMNIINQIEQNARDENWQKADLANDKLKEKWQNAKKILLFNFGAEEYLTLSNTINKLAAGIKAEDQGMILSDILILENIWSNYIKIVPEP